MREFVELRTSEEQASQYLRPEEGARLGTSVRKLLLDRRSSRFLELKTLAEQRLEEGECLFLYNTIHRRYTRVEMRAAEFYLVKEYCAPYGAEDFGTVFDDKTACVECHSGERVQGPLCMNTRKLPKTKPIIRTLESEVLVSKDLAELLRKHDVSGCELSPVVHRSMALEDNRGVRLERVPMGRKLLEEARALGLERSSAEYCRWLNLAAQTKRIELAMHEYYARYVLPAEKRHRSAAFYHVQPARHSLRFHSRTITGNGLFDLDERGEGRCSRRAEPGHVHGLNMISELHFIRETWPGTDISFTNDYVGTRRGMLRPASLMVINKRLYEILIESGIRGLKFEIAHAC